jgi:ParB family chromosome partitioning protein
MKKGSSKSFKDPNLQSLETSIIEKIGLKVFIKNSKKNNGTISIEYKDLDQLNKVVKILKSNY